MSAAAALDPPKKEPKKRKSRQKRQKNQPPAIEYEDPDLKVVVRLLPPSLKEEDFLAQAKALCPALGTELAWTRFFYMRGSRNVQAFEEPICSRAYFLFPTKETADEFKRQISGASFLEPESGDHYSAQTMKPIFGSVTQVEPATSLGDIIKDSLFIKFMASYAAKTKNIDLSALLSEIREQKRKENRKKKDSKASSKKSSKQNTPAPASRTEGTGKNEATADKIEATSQKTKRKRKSKKAKKTASETTRETITVPNTQQGPAAEQIDKPSETGKPKKKKKSRRERERAKKAQEGSKTASAGTGAGSGLDVSEGKRSEHSDPSNKKPSEENENTGEEKKKAKKRNRKRKPTKGSADSANPAADQNAA
ncbi:predicted protein [Clavispora lusitaniae ATCC 42720]|uniref:UPF3 domain-containing protein n=1 Tax=Clavispora lusitaniae (strain ATCC 42720) TaxID=306902 RepID=C4XX73_CLAL4|nr:uncharacterized protein CLUG_00546 [Clavispora lusitaniae ATCC 42720]EEQ36423.1 predicted protein [Clavispora lusitaniae ATCC 42720]